MSAQGQRDSTSLEVIWSCTGQFPFSNTIWVGSCHLNAHIINFRVRDSLSHLRSQSACQQQESSWIEDTDQERRINIQPCSNPIWAPFLNRPLISQHEDFMGRDLLIHERRSHVRWWAVESVRYPRKSDRSLHRASASPRDTWAIQTAGLQLQTVIHSDLEKALACRFYHLRVVISRPEQSDKHIISCIASHKPEDQGRKTHSVLNPLPPKTCTASATTYTHEAVGFLEK